MLGTGTSRTKEKKKVLEVLFYFLKQLVTYSEGKVQSESKHLVPLIP